MAETTKLITVVMRVPEAWDDERATSSVRDVVAAGREAAGVELLELVEIHPPCEDHRRPPAVLFMCCRGAAGGGKRTPKQKTAARRARNVWKKKTREKAKARAERKAKRAAAATSTAVAAESIAAE
jgi:hypothetical protein